MTVDQDVALVEQLARAKIGSQNLAVDRIGNLAVIDGAAVDHPFGIKLLHQRIIQIEGVRFAKENIQHKLRLLTRMAGERFKIVVALAHQLLLRPVEIRYCNGLCAIRRYFCCQNRRETINQKGMPARLLVNLRHHTRCKGLIAFSTILGQQLLHLSLCKLSEPHLSCDVERRTASQV